MKKGHSNSMWKRLLFTMVWTMSFSLFAQNVNVQGTVTDDTGETVIGATIIVEGNATTGTTTDFDGNYVLNNVPADANLVFSYVGMQTQTIPVNGRTTINVIMVSDTELLDEVVVVGFGTQRKVNLTGSVASIDSRMLENRPMTSVSAGLAGLLPGVSVNQQSGLPGADGGVIRVRGVGTLNSAAPMVLIDGVEASMNDVQANDIANISVLKDAASAAIYGSKAANGVILITTKSGRSGKPIITYSGDFGWQAPTRLAEYVNSADYAELYNEALANGGRDPRFTAEDIRKFRDGSSPFTHPNTDWQGLLYSGSGFLTTNNLSVSGGSEYADYRIAANYQKQDGIIKHTGKQEYNGRANLTVRPKDWITTNLNLSYTQMDRHEPNNAYVGGGLDQIIRQVNRIAPWIPYKNEDGTYGTISDGNPIAWIDLGPQLSIQRKTFVGIGSIQLDLFEGFNVKALVSHRTTSDDRNEMNKEIQYNPTKYHGPTKLTLRFEDRTRNTLDLTANYNKTFNNVHNLALLAGYHAEAFEYKRTQAYRENFPSTELTDLNAGSSSGMTNEGYTRQLNMTSLFGRVNYDYMGKYLFEANVRRDASSRFASDKRVGVFPSISAGWRISEEDFFANARNTIDNLKLRASWGQLGNQDALGADNSTNAYYPTIPTLDLGKNYPFNSVINSGAAIVAAKNAALLWEKTTTYGVGLDATFINRLNLTVDVYQKNTDGIIMEVPAPNEFALEKFFDNVGKLENRGIEVSLDYSDRFGEIDFRVGGNFAYNKNKLTQLAGTNEIVSGRKIRRIGESLDAWYGYKTDGLYKSEADIAAWATNKVYGNQIQPGDLRYVDVTGDNEVTPDDRTILGNSTPTMNFGFNINLGYKNFDFLALFQGTLGGYGYMDFDAVGAPNGDAQRPAILWKDRWNENNINATVPRLIANINGPSMPQTSTTSYWLRSTDYLRLKNLQLGYNVPSHLIENLGLSRLRVYYSAQNLFTLTNFLKGWDPEIPSGRGSGYPVVMTNSIGINVTF